MTGEKIYMIGCDHYKLYQNQIFFILSLDEDVVFMLNRDST